MSFRPVEKGYLISGIKENGYQSHVCVSDCLLRCHRQFCEGLYRLGDGSNENRDYASGAGQAMFYRC